MQIRPRQLPYAVCQKGNSTPQACFFSVSSISIPTKLKLYNTCILPIFSNGSECWEITKVDVRRIDALGQWCLRTMLGIKWHQSVRNDEVRRITKQPNLTAIIQSRRLSIFGHSARMDDDADDKIILTAPPPENWKRPQRGVLVSRGREPTSSH